MTDSAREAVRVAIEDHCRNRNWELLALNVRTDHVHVVAGFADLPPERMLGEWKAWSTRRLREKELVADDQPVWTQHGSTRYLWKEQDGEPTVRYVVEGQDPERFE